MSDSQLHNFHYYTYSYSTRKRKDFYTVPNTKFNEKKTALEIFIVDKRIAIRFFYHITILLGCIIVFKYD